MKVVHSKDVVFDEDSMLGIQKEPPSKCVELRVDEGADVEQVDAQNSANGESDYVPKTEHTGEDE